MTRLIRDSEMATYVHAASGRKFSAHLSLLCQYSPFFSRALKGPFKESTSKIVEIHDTEEWVLETFLDWLYYSEVCWIAKDCDGEEAEVWSQCELVQLNCFADQYDVPKLLKLTLRQLCHRLDFGTGVDADALLFAQDHLHDRSPILGMLAEALARFGLAPDDERKAGTFGAYLKPAFAALVVKDVLESCKRSKAQNNGVAPGKIDIDKLLTAVDGRDDETVDNESESEIDSDYVPDDDDSDDDEDEDYEDEYYEDDEDEAVERA